MFFSQFFVAIASYTTTTGDDDAHLKRKLVDISTLAMLAFPVGSEKLDENHPGLVRKVSVTNF